MFQALLREGVYLRLMEERHAEAVFSVVHRNREHLRPWLPWVDQSTESEYTRQFIRSSLEQFARNEGFSAAIWVGEEVAGAVGFHRISWPNKKVELGYWLASEFEGRGLMTDACRALVDHAFHNWQLNRVEIHCATGNSRSAAVAKRLGFALDGTMREGHVLYGAYHDLLIFAMLAKDWNSQNPGPVPGATA